MLKVFVLGRPGSGKTTAVNYIHEFAKSQGCPTLRFKDYDILYKMFREDIEREYQDNTKRKFDYADHDGFDVLDKEMFDIALERLEDEVKNALPSNAEGIATIEFARDDYEKTLRKFEPDFLKDAFFLLVNCDLETCIYRICSRLSDPPKPDYHFVSEYIMRSYYSTEKDFPCLEKVIEIENTQKPLEDFKKEVCAFAKVVVDAAIGIPV